MQEIQEAATIIAVFAVLVFLALGGVLVWVVHAISKIEIGDPRD